MDLCAEWSLRVFKPEVRVHTSNVQKKQKARWLHGTQEIQINMDNMHFITYIRFHAYLKYIVISIIYLKWAKKNEYHLMS